MNKQILTNDVKIDSTTTYLANGDINIHPCPWSEDVTLSGPAKKKSFRGRISIMEGGQTEVKRYNIGGNAPLYNYLFQTEHCDVFQSPSGKITERWKFAQDLTIHQVWDIRRREQPAVEAFFQTLINDSNQ
ncbi:MAG: hypothetical protein IKW44_03645 [Bacteroidaceae bacterium]|nr:hypothetical protein [Bacteroidaceae bacterium]